MEQVHRPPSYLGEDYYLSETVELDKRQKNVERKLLRLVMAHALQYALTCLNAHRCGHHCAATTHMPQQTR